MSTSVRSVAVEGIFAANCAAEAEADDAQARVGARALSLGFNEAGDLPPLPTSVRLEDAATLDAAAAGKGNNGTAGNLLSLVFNEAVLEVVVLEVVVLEVVVLEAGDLPPSPSSLRSDAAAAVKAIEADDGTANNLLLLGFNETVLEAVFETVLEAANLTPSAPS